jgi:hypothetical protein
MAWHKEDTDGVFTPPFSPSAPLVRMRVRRVPFLALAHSRARERLYASENRTERRSRIGNDAEALSSGRDISSNPPICSFHELCLILWSYSQRPEGAPLVKLQAP